MTYYCIGKHKYLYFRQRKSYKSNFQKWADVIVILYHGILIGWYPKIPYTHTWRTSSFPFERQRERRHAN